MKQRHNKGGAYAAALLYTVIIGFSFVFLKIALRIAGPLDVLAHRYTAALATALLLLLTGRFKLKGRLRDIVPLLPMALLYPACFFALQAFGLVYISSSEAGIFQSVAPIFTAVLAALFLKEYPSRGQQLCTILSVAGVIYLFFMKGTHLGSADFRGSALVLLSIVSLSGYSVLARKLTQKYDVVFVTCIMTLFGFLFFNGLSLAQHITAGTLNAYWKPLASRQFVLSTLYLGALSSFGSVLLSTYAISRLESVKMGAFLSLSTLVTVLAGVIVLHEQLFAYHIIGAAVIIAGVIGTNYFTASSARQSRIPAD